MSSLCRVLRYFKPYRARAALTLAFAILSTLTAMAPPYFVKVLVDAAVGSGSVRRLAVVRGGDRLVLFLARLFQHDAHPDEQPVSSSRSFSTCGKRSSPRCNGSPWGFTPIVRRES